MKADQIMDALGKVEEAYIMEAAPGGKPAHKAHTRWVAAAVAAVMLLAFFQTAPGAAALEIVKETLTEFIETMFPPKHIPITVEGETEAAPHEAGGQEPAPQDGGAATVPGFAIYYDTGRYVMTEEHGITYIRQITVPPSREEIRSNNRALLEGLTEKDAEAKIDELLARQEELYAGLPACEMEIAHLPDIQPATAAQAARDEAADVWESVTEVMDSEQPMDYHFSASTGEEWNSPREQVYFASDGQNGTFRVRVQYFLEAEEGHGARLTQMLHTFEVILP